MLNVKMELWIAWNLKMLISSKWLIALMRIMFQTLKKLICKLKLMFGGLKSNVLCCVKLITIYRRWEIEKKLPDMKS